MLNSRIQKGMILELCCNGRVSPSENLTTRQVPTQQVEVPHRNPRPWQTHLQQIHFHPSPPQLRRHHLKDMQVLCVLSVAPGITWSLACLTPPSIGYVFFIIIAFFFSEVRRKPKNLKQSHQLLHGLSLESTGYSLRKKKFRKYLVSVCSSCHAEKREHPFATCWKENKMRTKDVL